MCYIIPFHFSLPSFSSLLPYPKFWKLLWMQEETHNLHLLLILKGNRLCICLDYSRGKIYICEFFGFFQIYAQLCLQCFPLYTWGNICMILHKTTGSQLCCTLESPGELLKVQMSRTCSISIKSEPGVESSGAGTSIRSVLNFPRDPNM